MLSRKIEAISRIVRTLSPVAYPEPVSPPAVEGDLVSLFEERLDALRGPGDDAPALVRVAHVDDAARCVAEMCKDVPAGEIVWEPDSADASAVGSTDGKPRDRRVGVTPARALIARTGSVILDVPTRLAGRASLLVDRHVVVAGRDRIVLDLPAYYQRLSERVDAGERLPNQVCVTGCSRTADIEKLLVIPAHGPRQVRVILCEGSFDWAGFRLRVLAYRD